MMDEDLKDAVSPFPCSLPCGAQTGYDRRPDIGGRRIQGAAGRYSHHSYGRTKARLILVPVVDAVDTEPHI